MIEPFASGARALSAINRNDAGSAHRNAARGVESRRDVNVAAIGHGLFYADDWNADARFCCSDVIGRVDSHSGGAVLLGGQRERGDDKGVVERRPRWRL